MNNRLQPTKDNKSVIIVAKPRVPILDLKTMTVTPTSYTLAENYNQCSLRDFALKLLARDNELFIYKYDTNSKQDLLRQIAKDASDTNLSFNWDDAYICFKKTGPASDIPD